MDEEKPRSINPEPRVTGIEPGSIEGLEFVRASKLIPRYLSKRLKSRQDIEKYFEKSFREREGAHLSSIDLIGFRVFRKCKSKFLVSRGYWLSQGNCTVSWALGTTVSKGTSIVEEVETAKEATYFHFASAKPLKAELLRCVRFGHET